MMWKEISIEKYIYFGGKPENIQWCDARAAYSDSNQGKEIISYEDRGETGGGGCPLWYFTFKDGTVKRYAIIWVFILVEFKLDEKYTS